MTSDRCYVSLPFGKGRIRDGTEIDFDRLYAEAIRPAVADHGFTPVRADSLVSAGVLNRAIIEAVARADVMIVDISMNHMDVAYELGLRHALAPRATLVLVADGAGVPGDLAELRTITYPRGDDFDAVRQRLAEALDGLAAVDVDSPFFEFFPVTPYVLPGSRPRDEENVLRSRLVEARKMLPEDALPELRELESDVLASGQDDNRLLTDLMLAYRDKAAWDDVIRLIDGFPPDLRSSPIVAQHEASALNRRGRPGDDAVAAAILEGLIDRIGPDSESFGMLGRIHKDRWSRTGERQHLHAAIAAYRNGWLADPDDYYPGINLATLLHVAGEPAAEAELGESLPRLRDVVDARLGSPRADYWDIATGMELAVLGRDWDRAKELVAPLRTRVASPWMFETTHNNLSILLGAMADEDDRRQLSRLMRQLESEEVGA